MAEKVVVYTKNDCAQCRMTKRLLDTERIEYQEINLDENPQFIEYIKNELGFGAAPVIKTENDKWCGFRPDKIKAIKN